MTKFAVSPEGAESLRKLAQDVRNLMDHMFFSGRNLQNTMMSLDEELGVFSDEAIVLSSDCVAAVVSASLSSAQIASLLESKANVVDALVGNACVSNSSGSDSSANSGLAQGAENASGAASGQSKFGCFDLAPIKGGSDFFVKGSNYDQFIEDYYHSERSTYESLGSNEIVTTISPGSIEGIHLGETEASDSTIFWSQHESAGTRESFMEIASHIPEIENLLNRGMSLEEVKANPSLEKCANIYFEPSNIPRVVQSNGYFEFDSNGRHRILAAREAGINIPVKIVGIRKWK